MALTALKIGKKEFGLSHLATAAVLLIGMGSFVATVFIFWQVAPEDAARVTGLNGKPWDVPYLKLVWALVGCGVWMWNLFSLAICVRLVRRRGAGLTEWIFAGLVFILSMCVFVTVLVNVNEFGARGEVQRETARIEAKGEAAGFDQGALREAIDSKKARLEVLTEPNNANPNQSVRRIRRGPAAVQADADAARANGDEASARRIEGLVPAAEEAARLQAEVQRQEEQLLAARLASSVTANEAARAQVMGKQPELLSWAMDNKFAVFSLLAELVLFIGASVIIALRKDEDEERIALAEREAQLARDKAIADAEAEAEVLRIKAEAEAAARALENAAKGDDPAKATGSGSDPDKGAGGDNGQGAGGGQDDEAAAAAAAMKAAAGAAAEEEAARAAAAANASAAANGADNSGRIPNATGVEHIGDGAGGKMNPPPTTLRAAPPIIELPEATPEELAAAGYTATPTQPAFA